MYVYVPQEMQGFKTDYVFVVLICLELINTSADLENNVLGREWFSRICLIYIRELCYIIGETKVSCHTFSSAKYFLWVGKFDLKFKE